MDLLSHVRSYIPLRDKPLEGFAYTLLFGVLWVTLYLLSGTLTSLVWRGYRALTRPQKIEWDTRLISSVHAMTAMWGIYRTMFTDPLYRKPELEFTFETTTEGMMAAAITLSYWYYDLVVSVIHWKHVGEWAMVVHHVVGIVPFTLGMYHSHLVYYASMVIVTEFSTPFVNNRWFFAVLKKTDSLFYVVNGLLMWLSFLLCRVIWLPYLLYVFWAHRDELSRSEFLVWAPTVVGVIVTLALSTYWYVLITKGLLKAVGLIGAPKDTSVGNKKMKAK